MDCYDGMIVGFKVDDHMRAELCVEAFERACRAHKATGMIVHSDRGSQYTGKALRDALSRV